MRNTKVRDAAMLLALVFSFCAGQTVFANGGGWNPMDRMTIVIEGMNCTFVNGRYTGSHECAVIGDLRAAIDINGDKLADEAFVVEYSGGGSGTFSYLVCAVNNGHGYEYTNAVLIGDRVRPYQVYMDSRTKALCLEYYDRKADEPMAADPTVLKKLYMRLMPQLVPVG